jgi:hypothetical protein
MPPAHKDHYPSVDQTPRGKKPDYCQMAAMSQRKSTSLIACDM